MSKSEDAVQGAATTCPQRHCRLWTVLAGILQFYLLHTASHPALPAKLSPKLHKMTPAEMDSPDVTKRTATSYQ